MVVNWANGLASLLIQPAPPGFAALPWAATPQPAYGMSGPRIRQVVYSFKLVGSKTRTYHGQVGAGWGRLKRRRCYSPRRHRTVLPAQDSTTFVLDDFSEARTSENLCKPMEEQNPRLPRVLLAFDPGLSIGTKSVLRSWLRNSGPSHCSGTCLA